MRLFTSLVFLALASRAQAACDSRIHEQWDYTTLAPVCGSTSLIENGGTSVRVTTTVCGPSGKSFSMVNDNNGLYVSTGVTDVAAASTNFAFDGFVYSTAFTNATGCIWCANSGFSLYINGSGNLVYATAGSTLTGDTAMSLNTCYYYAFVKTGTTSKKIYIYANPPASMNFTATVDKSDANSGAYTTGNAIHGRGFSAGTFIVGYLNLPAFWTFSTVPSSFPPTISTSPSTNRSTYLHNFPSPYLGVHR